MRSRILCVTLYLTLGALGQAEEASPSLLGKVLQAYGGRARLESLRSLKMLQGPVKKVGDTIIWRRDSDARIEFIGPSSVDTTILTDTHALFVNREGDEIYLEPAAAQSLRVAMFLTSLPFQLPMLLTLDITETSSDAERPALAFTLAGARVHLSVDPATWLVESATAQPPTHPGGTNGRSRATGGEGKEGGRYISVAYQQHREKDGISFPLHQMWGKEPYAVSLATTILLPNSKVGDALFSESGTLEISGGAPRVTTPIHLHPDQFLSVTVTLGDRGRHDFVFDTGASETSMDMRFARSLSLTGVPHKNITTQYGVVESELVKFPSASMGGVTFNNYLWEIMPLSQLDVRTGIIGAGLLQAGPCEINFVETLLTIHQPDAFRPPAGAIPLTLQFRQHCPFITMSVNETLTADLLVDTGAVDGIQIRLLDPFFAGGRVKREEFKGLRLSRTSLPLAAGVIQISRGQYGGPGTQGLVGLKFFRDRFTRIIFDRSRHLLWVVPKALLGISFSGSSLKLAKLSELQKSDLRVDDLLTHLDGQPVTTGQEVRTILAQRRPDETVKCTVQRNGEAVEIPVRLLPAFE